MFVLFCVSQLNAVKQYFSYACWHFIRLHCIVFLKFKNRTLVLCKNQTNWELSQRESQNGTWIKTIIVQCFPLQIASCWIFDMPFRLCNIFSVMVTFCGGIGLYFDTEEETELRKNPLTCFFPLIWTFCVKSVCMSAYSDMHVFKKKKKRFIWYSMLYFNCY